jgi:prepilin-type processing-associated H-X9-DG protein
MDAKAVGYVSARAVPSDPLAEEAMVARQTRAIAAECERRGWILDELFVDRGRSVDDLTRPGLLRALNVLAADGHVAMVVERLDRVTRRPAFFAELVGRSRGTWELVVAS